MTWEKEMEDAAIEAWRKLPGNWNQKLGHTVGFAKGAKWARNYNNEEVKRLQALHLERTKFAEKIIAENESLKKQLESVSEPKKFHIEGPDQMIGFTGDELA